MVWGSPVCEPLRSLWTCMDMLVGLVMARSRVVPRLIQTNYTILFRWIIYFIKAPRRHMQNIHFKLLGNLACIPKPDRRPVLVTLLFLVKHTVETKHKAKLMTISSSPGKGCIPWQQYATRPTICTRDGWANWIEVTNKKSKKQSAQIWRQKIIQISLQRTTDCLTHQGKLNVLWCIFCSHINYATHLPNLCFTL